MIDLFGGSTGDDQLVDLGGRRGEHGIHVQVRSTDFAVRLNGEDSPQQVDVLGVLPPEVLLLDAIAEHALKRSAFRRPSVREFAHRAAVEKPPRYA